MRVDARAEQLFNAKPQRRPVRSGAPSSMGERLRGLEGAGVALGERAFLCFLVYKRNHDVIV